MSKVSATGGRTRGGDRGPRPGRRRSLKAAFGSVSDTSHVPSGRGCSSECACCPLGKRVGAAAGLGYARSMRGVRAGSRVLTEPSGRAAVLLRRERNLLTALVIGLVRRWRRGGVRAASKSARFRFTFVSVSDTGRVHTGHVPNDGRLVRRFDPGAGRGTCAVVMPGRRAADDCAAIRGGRRGRR